jgi:hypothetical protein
VLCRAAVVSMITKSTVCASVAGAVIVTFLVAATTVGIGSAMGNVGLSSAPGGKAVIGSPSIMKRKVRYHASTQLAHTTVDNAGHASSPLGGSCNVVTVARDHAVVT